METRIEIENGVLRQLTRSDSLFIHELFSDAYVRKYYVLRSDHAADIDSFVQYMIDEMANMAGLDYIIQGESGRKVGLITAELMRDSRTGEVMWNVGYAVAPQYRNHGYATAALNGLTDYLLNTFSIQKVSLDISTDNIESEVVARKCGFKQPSELGERIGYFDPDHMEIGMRIRWFKSIESRRVMLFNQACDCYRSKDYSSALALYQKAMDEPYPEGTPFTDAQIWANMGMAYSSIGEYSRAFSCLKRSQAMGLNNPSIEKELRWLRDNIGLF